MGTYVSKPKDYSENILVATLNYGGIIKGPFQFFSGTSDQEKLLSQTFHELMELEHYRPLIGDFVHPKHTGQKNQEKGEQKGKFEWKIGKIDKDAQTERYTPVYNKDAGVENNRLVSEQRFKQLWEDWCKSRWNKSAKKQVQEDRYDDKKNKIHDCQKAKSAMMGFDLIAYHAILKVVYGQAINEKEPLANQNLERLSVAPYKKFMDSYFQRTYLNRQKKIRKLKELLERNFHKDLTENGENVEGSKKIDVLFLQEVEKKQEGEIGLIEDLENERYSNGDKKFRIEGKAENGDVIIIIRNPEDNIEVPRAKKISENKERPKLGDAKVTNTTSEQLLNTGSNSKMQFQATQNKSSKKQDKTDIEKVENFKKENMFSFNKQMPQKKALFGINETNLVVWDRYLLLGLHLSSKVKAATGKTSPNQDQKEKLKAGLNQLNTIQSSYDIIAAGDINSFLSDEDLKNFKIYPGHQSWMTTIKKRTYMQAQYLKAHENVRECKDHIITNANIVKSGIITIDMKTADQRFLLPTNDHPFDHFMVITLIKRRPKYNLRTGKLQGEETEEQEELKEGEQDEYKELKALKIVEVSRLDDKKR